MTPMETKNPIWFCIPRTICWLTQARDTAGTSLDSETRAGINYSIILNAACFVVVNGRWNAGSRFTFGVWRRGGNNSFPSLCAFAVIESLIHQ